MRVSVITQTADRPRGIELCERYMARQKVQPHEWIVADGGQTWTVTGGNAAGTNTWEPGVFGWTAEGGEDCPEFRQPMAGDPPYMTGDRVTFNGSRYVCNRDNVTHSPAAWPAAWDLQS